MYKVSEHFISEAITPVVATSDTARMAAGEPGLPSEFVWRGRTIQVTAVRRNGQWFVIEYNIRLGVTSGPMILRMLRRPAEVVLRTAQNKKLNVAFKEGCNFGCSVTLAGYGYPYVQVCGPPVPLEVTAPFDGDVWWNEVERDAAGCLRASGHRIADVVGLAPPLEAATAHAYTNIRKIRCLGSYSRPDIGRSLWPPGTV